MAQENNLPGSENITRQSRWRRLSGFAKELWNDHDFWIRAIAVKGGASTIVLAGVIGISFCVSLPFAFAAAGIAVCGGVVVLGAYGILLGINSSIEKLREIYAKTISGKPLPQKSSPAAIKSLYQKMSEYPRLKTQLEKPWVKKVMNSRTWKIADRLAQKPQDLFLTGLAMKGSVFWAVVSGITLVTHLLVLPVVAVGSLITVTTIVATGGLLSGAYGIYLSAQKVLHTVRDKKKPKEDAAEPDNQTIVAPPVPLLPQASPSARDNVSVQFDAASEKGRNTPTDQDPPAVQKSPAAKIE